MADFNLFMFIKEKAPTISLIFPIHPSIVYTLYPLSRCSIGQKAPKTQDRSAVLYRLTQFHTHIHTSGKFSGCSQLDLHVFGLQEDVGAPRGKAV